MLLTPHLFPTNSSNSFSLIQMTRHPALRPVPCPALLPRPVPEDPTAEDPTPAVETLAATTSPARTVPSPTPVASSSSTTSSKLARRLLGMVPSRTIGTTTSSKRKGRGRNTSYNRHIWYFWGHGANIFTPHHYHTHNMIESHTHTNQPPKQALLTRTVLFICRRFF